MNLPASCAVNGCNAAGSGSPACERRWLGWNAAVCANQKYEICEHLALARNAVGHHAVKGGDAVRGGEEQPVAEIKHFANLAAFEFADAGQIELQNWFVHRPEYGVRAARWKVESRVFWPVPGAGGPS